jgi:hypothetical protein
MTKTKKPEKESNKKKKDCDEPIWCRMKKRSPSSGQNGELVHWWVLVHFGPENRLT